jgi:MSHA biogenesis protein MshJ
MNKLIRFNLALKTKFVGLTRREQVAITVALIAVIYFFADHFVYQPQQETQTAQELKNQIERSTLALLNASIAEINQSGAAPAGLVAQIQELEKLEQQASTIDAVLQSVQGTTPQISALIRNLIAKQTPVVLHSIKTVPSRPLIGAGGALPTIQPSNSASTAPPGTIYRHGVELQLKGQYLDLAAYLRTLERNAQGAFWANFRMTVDRYPESTLTLTIYILSKEVNPILL